MEDLTLISCSYNTPEVTITMLKSFFAHHDSTSVLLKDNSTDNKTELLLKANEVPYLRTPGGLHNRSVDSLLKKVNTRYALLVDTDIIFLKDQTPIFEKFKQSGIVLLGDVCGDRGGKKIHYRVHPWYCWIDVKAIKDNKIQFFNEQKQFTSSERIYDVGCTFFEDIKLAGLKVGDIKLENNYFKHYEGMSWRTKRYGNSDGDIDHDSNAVHNNINLYQYGLFTEKLYKSEIETYKHINIKCKK